MVRGSVNKLVRLGPLPDADSSSPERIQEYQSVLERISPPLTDEEARLLVPLFGTGDCFGLAWTLLHLIESAPSPAIDSPPSSSDNEWIRRLWSRAQNQAAREDLGR